VAAPAATPLDRVVMLMTAYATGLRPAEPARWQIGDIDRMVIHVRGGKGRDV